MSRSLRFALLIAAAAFCTVPAQAGPANDFAAALKSDLAARGFSDASIEASADDGDSVVITGLRVVSPQAAGHVLTIGEVRVIRPKSGVQLLENDVTVKGYRLSQPIGTTASFPTLDMTGVTGPASAWIASQFFGGSDIQNFAIDAMKSVSVKSMHVPLAEVSAKSKLRAPKVSTYRDMRMTDIVAGRYGFVSTGAIAMEDDDEKVSIAAIEARNIDALSVVGSENETQTLVDSLRVSGLTVKKGDEAPLQIDAITLKRLVFLPGKGTMNQLLLPTMAAMEKADGDDESKKKAARDAAHFAVEFLDRISIDEIAIIGMQQDKESDPMSLEAATVTGIGKGRIEAISFKNLRSLKEEEPLQLGEFRLEGFDATRTVAVARRYLSGEFDDNTIYPALMREGMPSLKRLIFNDVLSRDKDENPISAEHISLAFGEMIGIVPSRVTTKVRNLKVVLEDKKDVQEMMGGDTATLHISADTIYDPDRKTIEIKDAEINVDQVGAFTYSLALANIDRSILENITERYLSLVGDTQFTGMSMKFVNHGVVERAMNAGMKKKKVKEAAFKKKLTADIAKQISKSVKDKELAAQMLSAAQMFIASPKSVKFEIAPRDAMTLVMAVMALGQIKDGDASDLTSQFRVNIEANQ